MPRRTLCTFSVLLGWSNLQSPSHECHPFTESTPPFSHTLPGSQCPILPAQGERVRGRQPPPHPGHRTEQQPHPHGREGRLPLCQGAYRRIAALCGVASNEEWQSAHLPFPGSPISLSSSRLVAPKGAQLIVDAANSTNRVRMVSVAETNTLTYNARVAPIHHTGSGGRGDCGVHRLSGACEEPRRKGLQRSFQHRLDRSCSCLLYTSPSPRD